jgi:hypothetical protein
VSNTGIDHFRSIPFLVELIVMALGESKCLFCGIFQYAHIKSGCAVFKRSQLHVTVTSLEAAVQVLAHFFASNERSCLPICPFENLISETTERDTKIFTFGDLH